MGYAAPDQTALGDLPGPVGGVSYLNEIRGPLPDIAMMPTGGVTLDAVEAYLAAGAAAVGISGAVFMVILLCAPPAVPAKPVVTIHEKLGIDLQYRQAGKPIQ